MPDTMTRAEFLHFVYNLPDWQRNRLSRILDNQTKVPQWDQFKEIVTQFYNEVWVNFFQKNASLTRIQANITNKNLKILKNYLIVAAAGAAGRQF